MTAVEQRKRESPLRPVLYLDVDDTIVSWSNYRATPARGVREFLAWALEHFEVRWLTRRCPSGEMPSRMVDELCGMMSLPSGSLGSVLGLDWETCESKLNGIAWLDHLVLGRPFVWVEDENGAGARELAVLDELGCREQYFHVNVSYQPDSLLMAHQRLREWLREARSGPRLDRGGEPLPCEPVQPAPGPP